MNYNQRVMLLKAGAENLSLFITHTDRLKDVLAAFDGKKVDKEINNAIGYDPNCRITVYCSKNSSDFDISFVASEKYFKNDLYDEDKIFLDYTHMDIRCERSVRGGKLHYAAALPQIDAKIEQWRRILDEITSADYDKLLESYRNIANQIVEFRKVCSPELMYPLYFDFKFKSAE